VKLVYFSPASLSLRDLLEFLIPTATRWISGLSISEACIVFPYNERLLTGKGSAVGCEDRSLRSVFSCNHFRFIDFALAVLQGLFSLSFATHDRDSSGRERGFRLCSCCGYRTWSPVFVRSIEVLMLRTHSIFAKVKREMPPHGTASFMSRSGNNSCLRSVIVRITFF
jgi:hypothetical protein